MKLIVAVDEQWGIGKSGDLLMSIPDDMKYFREKTRNAMLIMGYNTLLSFPGGKPLPGRLNIVLADIKDLRTDRTITVNSLDELFTVISSLNSDELYVIGGGYTYRQLLPYCDTAYITKMRFTGDADTFIPNLDEEKCWHIEDESELMDHEGIKYSFVTYRNDSVKEISFNGCKSELASFFKKKEDFSMMMPKFDSDDTKEEYLLLLDKLKNAYFHPLKDGINYCDIKDDLNSNDASLENILKNRYLIADRECFDDLYSKYSTDRISEKEITISRD